MRIGGRPESSTLALPSHFLLGKRPSSSFRKQMVAVLLLLPTPTNIQLYHQGSAWHTVYINPFTTPPRMQVSHCTIVGICTQAVQQGRKSTGPRKPCTRHPQHRRHFCCIHSQDSGQITVGSFYASSLEGFVYTVDPCPTAANQELSPNSCSIKTKAPLPDITTAGGRNVGIPTQVRWH